MSLVSGSALSPPCWMLHAFVLCLLLADFVSAKPSKSDKGKKSQEPKGSQKCEQGLFGSLVKDSAVPLCDEHFPDASSKSGWVIAFYNKDAEKLHDTMNRVAIDLGNEPPQKSKAIKSQKKKQRQRIKDLAEKYEFEAIIPKKGLEDKGKDPLLKTGAVCCDCGKDYEVCKARGTGVFILQPGKDEKVMTDATDVDSLKADDIMKFVMGELGFMKGYESSSSSSESSSSSSDAGSEGKQDDPSKKLAELQAAKKKAVADEDFKLAKELKAEIEKLEKKLQSGSPRAAEGDLASKLKELQEAKKQAAADEDYERAKELKEEIAKIEKKLKGEEL